MAGSRRFRLSADAAHTTGEQDRGIAASSLVAYMEMLNKALSSSC